MTDSPKRRITVFGGTGAQGRSVVHSLLRNPNFLVRAITRNPTSENAQILAAGGADVFQGDGFDAAAMEKAFEGSWGAFINTNTADPSLEEGKREVELGETVLRAAKKAGVEVVVHSAYPLRAENKINQLAKSMGFKHVLSVIPGWYMENFKHPMHFGNGYYPFGGFPSVPDADGVVRMRYPSVSGEKESGIPIVSIKDDFGDIVHGLLLNPEKYDGKTVLAIGEVLEYDELTTQFTKVTGKEAQYVELPLEEMPSGSLFMDDLQKLWKNARDNQGRFLEVETDLEPAKKLKRVVIETVGGDSTGEKSLKSWKNWVAENLV